MAKGEAKTPTAEPGFQAGRVIVAQHFYPKLKFFSAQNYSELCGIQSSKTRHNTKCSFGANKMKSKLVQR